MDATRTRRSPRLVTVDDDTVLAALAARQTLVTYFFDLLPHFTDLSDGRTVQSFRVSKAFGRAVDLAIHDLRMAGKEIRTQSDFFREAGWILLKIVEAGRDGPHDELHSIVTAEEGQARGTREREMRERLHTWAVEVRNELVRLVQRDQIERAKRQIVHYMAEAQGFDPYWAAEYTDALEKLPIVQAIMEIHLDSASEREN